jgi:hypothetical protein
MYLMLFGAPMCISSVKAVLTAGINFAYKRRTS